MTVGAFVALLAIVAAACGSTSSDGASSATTAATSATSAPPSTVAPSTTAGAGVTEAPAPTATAELAPWQTIAITDVDGVTFTLADFVGKSVFVENFATWCPTCRRQLGSTQGAAAAVGDSSVVLALSVETDLSSQDVADYAKDNGFTDVRFAVMSEELLAAFVDAFGNSAVNPPSTPHVFIGADGAAGDMATGSISEDDIVAQLRALA
jgi:thiol-disulfide isomerase/thioredoxin